MPNPVRAALMTALFTFLSLFLGTATGWLTQAAEAVQNGSEIPSLTILTSAAVSALFASLAGLGNWVLRYAQERTGRGTQPVYVKARSGGAAVVSLLDALIERAILTYLRTKEALSRYIPMRYSSTYLYTDEDDGTVYLCKSRWWQRLGNYEDPDTGEIFPDCAIILKSDMEMVSINDDYDDEDSPDE